MESPLCYINLCLIGKLCIKVKSLIFGQTYVINYFDNNNRTLLDIYVIIKLKEQQKFVLLLQMLNNETIRKHNDTISCDLANELLLNKNTSLGYKV